MLNSDVMSGAALGSLLPIQFRSPQAPVNAVTVVFWALLIAPRGPSFEKRVSCVLRLSWKISSRSNPSPAAIRAKVRRPDARVVSGS